MPTLLRATVKTKPQRVSDRPCSEGVRDKEVISKDNALASLVWFYAVLYSRNNKIHYSLPNKERTALGLFDLFS